MRYVETDSKLEVMDNATGLVWQKAVTEWLTHKRALEHARTVAESTGVDWRLPSIEELSSLIDHGRSNPASTFPQMPVLAFWSSSLFVDEAIFVWNVSFRYGVVDYNNGGYYLAVRLVRGG
jgi:hypothetical protein